MTTSDISAKKAILINSRDSVATAIKAISKGEKVTLGNTEITVCSDIPFGHKFALKDVLPGDKVIKYGEPIGVATTSISTGEHVHTHNLESTRGRGDRCP